MGQSNERRAYDPGESSARLPVTLLNKYRGRALELRDRFESGDTEIINPVLQVSLNQGNVTEEGYLKAHFASPALPMLTFPQNPFKLDGMLFGCLEEVSITDLSTLYLPDGSPYGAALYLDLHDNDVPILPADIHVGIPTDSVQITVPYNGGKMLAIWPTELGDLGMNVPVDDDGRVNFKPIVDGGLAIELSKADTHVLSGLIGDDRFLENTQLG